MQLINTIWLWALSGLIVPIGIHLLSRRSGKIIRFGSIRHLEDTSTRQFRSIQINELLLLVLRCLLIALVVLLLAGIHINTSVKKDKWLLIEKGLENDPDFEMLIDSLDREGFQIKTLAAGFPVNNDTSKYTKADYWSLLHELKSKGQIVVLSYSYAEGFRGKRTNLPKHVTWLSKEPDSAEYVLKSFISSKDSFDIRFGKSTPDITSFDFRKTGNPGREYVSTEESDSISVAVVFSSEFDYDKNIIVATLAAIDSKTPNHLRVEAFPLEQFVNAGPYHWVIWLSDSSPPALKGNLIRFTKDEMTSGNLFSHSKSTPTGDIWLLSAKLNEEVALQENIAVQLANILFPDDEDREQWRRLDKRVLPEELRWSTKPFKSEMVSPDPTQRFGQEYIALMLMVILFAERLLSFKRDQ